MEVQTTSLTLSQIGIPTRSLGRLTPLLGISMVLLDAQRKDQTHGMPPPNHGTSHRLQLEFSYPYGQVVLARTHQAR